MHQQADTIMHQQADTIMSNIIGEHRKCRAAKSEEEDPVDVLLKVQDQGILTLL